MKPRLRPAAALRLTGLCLKATVPAVAAVCRPQPSPPGRACRLGPGAASDMAGAQSPQQASCEAGEKGARGPGIGGPPGRPSLLRAAVAGGCRGVAAGEASPPGGTAGAGLGVPPGGGDGRAGNTARLLLALPREWLPGAKMESVSRAGQEISLAALKQHDPYITSIADVTGQVALYSFSPKANEWVSAGERPGLSPRPAREAAAQPRAGRSRPPAVRGRGSGRPCHGRSCAGVAAGAAAAPGSCLPSPAAVRAPEGARKGEGNRARPRGPLAHSRQPPPERLWGWGFLLLLVAVAELTFFF